MIVKLCHHRDVTCEMQRGGKSVTVHPEVPSALVFAVKVHCLTHMRIVCIRGPPLAIRMSVVTVSVRCAMLGQ